MNNQKENSRRNFLRNAAAISALSVFPTVLTKAMSGVEMPLSGLAGAGERVNLA